MNNKSNKNQTRAIHGAHLVGSVPLTDSATVFNAASRHLGACLKRLPDGETGTRSNWIKWQQQVLANCPQLEPVTREHASATATGFGLRDGCTGDDVRFGPLGYSAAAIASYAEFAKQKQSGEIDKTCRFQVSLPTPIAPIQFYVSSEYRRVLEPVYESRLLRELDEITRAIPHHELAIQWDTAVEFGILEGTFASHLENPFPEIVERLLRLGNAVPEAVELGYHLCYGDSKHKHFVEPRDAGHLVAVSNAVANGLHRALHWIHLPVPRDRVDDAFYRPLTSLQLGPDTELYLGLVHMTDGETGTKQRIRTAQQFVDRFGIATECGFGRRPAETVTTLLKLHATLASQD